MIIAIANQNGGAEKSILAANLATYRALSGRKILLVDSDPMQTSFNWSKRRHAANVTPAPAAQVMQNRSLYPALQDMASRYDEVIIDAERYDTAASRSALTSAHMAIIPIQMHRINPMDQATLVRRLELARLFNPCLRVLFVASCVPANSAMEEFAKLHAMAEQTLTSSVSPVIIHDHDALRHAFHEGLSLWEYKKEDAHAMAEMTALCKDVFSGDHASVLARTRWAVAKARVAGIRQLAGLFTSTVA